MALEILRFPFEMVEEIVEKNQKEIVGNMIWLTFGEPDIEQFGNKYLEEVEGKTEEKEWTLHLIHLTLAFKL